MIMLSCSRKCLCNFQMSYISYLVCCLICRGAALPTKTPGIPCIFDPLGRAGICGDWLLGSNLESAALSGISLANHVSASANFWAFLIMHLNFIKDQEKQRHKGHRNF